MREESENREMESKEVHDIVIIGGGIVGLATALALHRKGIRSLVLEKSSRIRTSGAAIGVFINGWRALDQLGVGATLLTTAIPILEMHDTLVSQNKTRVTSCRNEKLHCLKRSDLVEALANALPTNSVRFGCQVVAIGTDPLTSFPIIHFDDGTNIKAKILIGCDGSNSIVAKSIGLEAPRLFPMHGIRGFTNYPNGHIYGSNGFRIRISQVVAGRIPVDDKLVYWFVGCQCPPQDTKYESSSQDIQDFTLDLVKEFPADIVEMVKNCDLDSLSLTHMRYRAPWNFLYKSMWKNTTTVAGDAMHVMCPFLGQGGSCGLEDAVVLARCLAREIHLNSDFDDDDDDDIFKKKVGTALKSYVNERRFRVMRLSTQSYLTGLLVISSSWAKKFILIVILLGFFGGMSLNHARYDCGSLMLD